MFADDRGGKLKNLDLYVNIIYKEGMQNILKVLRLDILIRKAPYPLRRMYYEFEQTDDKWFDHGLMFDRIAEHCLMERFDGQMSTSGKINS